ncbi:hypothetical protein EXU48_08930 [Occultella glacieicola]|uniref:Aminoglycoside phosphotransferase domain-containing protein n=1 Tax=Occultella glacieicola TaxID=2518684 RepID=A0ABY2E5W9_9MICO|nr:hypothetical protein [Occultella glacieicola]TDE94900.1 hypothetical protein EXU48_08930 [Occultella glacieicola]
MNTTAELAATLAGHDHRQAHAHLVRAGWSVCGVGDWAVTLRSPDGTLAARVSPFDPAYPVFVDLCRRLEGTAQLPRVEADLPLPGGGQLTIMEFLLPAPADVAERVRASWAAGDDPELAAVRRAAEDLDATARREVPWWDGIDLNPGNVMRALDGRIVLVDVFCLDGAALYAALLADPAGFAVRVPADRGRYLTEIAYIARNSIPAEITALRAAALEAHPPPP